MGVLQFDRAQRAEPVDPAVQHHFAGEYLLLPGK